TGRAAPRRRPARGVTLPPPPLGGEGLGVRGRRWRALAPSPRPLFPEGRGRRGTHGPWQERTGTRRATPVPAALPRRRPNSRRRRPRPRRGRRGRTPLRRRAAALETDHRRRRP